MKSSAPFFERLFDIRKEEFRRVLLMSAYLLLIIASYSIIKAVRDSLFVTKIGPAQLPYVYLLIAGAMGLVSIVYSRAVNRIGLKRLIRTTSLIAISNLLLFWLIFQNDTAHWFYVLYVWASLFGAITASQFWLLATHVFDAREARRVFSWIGVGGILGGVLGGAVTNRMAHWLGTESLLMVCAVMVAATLIVLEQVGDVGPVVEAQQSVPGEEPPDVFREVRSSRHLVMMIVLLSAAVIVEAFIDYEYKVVATQAIRSKDHLTAFFGSVTFYIGIFSLLFQTLVSNRILKRFGVGWAIQLLPVALLGAFATLAAKPVLWAAAMLQLVDGGFSYSIHRSGMELLYLPIPPQTRNAVKGFIDTFVDRVGRAVGAVLLLLCTVVLALSIRSLSIIACGFVVAWIATALVMKHAYMDSFRKALEKTSIEPEALHLRDIDGATMRTLLKVLSSDDERQVLYALDLLNNTHPNRWRPYIDLLIRHPSSAVRARTIAVLASWNDPAISGDEFIHHPDYETARIAMASALRLHWSDRWRDRQLLNILLHDSYPPVVREAIVTAGEVRYMDAMPLLIASLADKALRGDARRALAHFGVAIIPELVRRLSDVTENPAIRGRIPKTLALCKTQEAAGALLRQLHAGDYRLDYAVLKALNQLHADRPDLEMERSVVVAAIVIEREEYDQLRHVHSWLERNPAGGELFSLLMRAINERMEQRVERIFRLVALMHPPPDIYSAYYNFHIKPALRPAAIEFLDNLLDPQLKQTVVPLLEEPDGLVPNVQFASFAAAFSALSAGDDPWLKTIIAELGSYDSVVVAC